MIFSCIIPASRKDAKSQMLKDLIASIRAQDFPQDQIEIIVVTNVGVDGHILLNNAQEDVIYINEDLDSEQAKARGIREAKGEICAMFCADNYIIDKYLFNNVKVWMDKAPGITGCYSKFYWREKKDNSLNRYFSLIGNNDTIPFYLNKCDRLPHYKRDKNVSFSQVSFKDEIPSLGDNGFFYRKSHLNESVLEHYYPMDIAEDLRKRNKFTYWRFELPCIWHRTSDKLLTFLIKRYKYARDLYCDRTDRRWKMLDTREDYLRLLWFIIATISIVPALFISIKGFLKIRDWAWFWHWPVCVGFLLTYGLLACRNLIKHRSLFQVSTVQNPLKVV